MAKRTVRAPKNQTVLVPKSSKEDQTMLKALEVNLRTAERVAARLRAYGELANFEATPGPLTQAEKEVQADINRILDRLDVEIPEAQKRMDELLVRLRTTRIVVAA